jgi:hypothetical protein
MLGNVTPPQIPFSVTGRSTIFGLNFDGSIDHADNGQGAFGYNTRDKSLIGCSLPIPILEQSIGKENYGFIRNREFTVSILSHVTDKYIRLVPIVDMGPAEWTGNLVDLTYGATEALGHHDNGVVTLWITEPQGVIQIKGWNFGDHKAL